MLSKPTGEEDMIETENIHSLAMPCIENPLTYIANSNLKIKSHQQKIAKHYVCRCKLLLTRKEKKRKKAPAYRINV